MIIVWTVITLASLVLLYKMLNNKTADQNRAISDMQQQIQRQQEEIEKQREEEQNSPAPVVISTVPYYGGGYGAYPYFYRGRGWHGGRRGRR